MKRRVSGLIAVGCAGMLALALLPGCGGAKPSPSAAKSDKKVKPQKTKPASDNGASTVAKSGDNASNPFFAPANSTPTTTPTTQPAETTERPTRPTEPVGREPAVRPTETAPPVLTQSPEHPIPGKPFIKANGGIRDFVWSRDGRRLAAVAYNQLITVNVFAGVIERTPVIAANQMALSPDEETIAVTAPGNSIEFRPFREPAAKPSVKTPAQEKQILELAYSSDGTVVYSTSYEDSALKVWNPADGTLVKEIPVGNLNIHLMAASPKGDLVALSGSVGGADERQLRLFDAKFEKVRHELDNPEQSVPTSFAFSADGKTLAVGCDYKPMIRLFDTESGKLVKELTGHGKEIRTLAFSADGQRLVSGAFDNSVRVWDLATGTSLAELLGSQSFVYGVAFAPQVPWVVSGDGTSIRFWNIDEAIKDPLRYSKTGEETRNWNAHAEGGLWHFDVSRDGRRLVSLGNDDVKLWDIESGRVLKTITTDKVEGTPPVAVSPDGTQFAFVSKYRSIALHSIPDGEHQHTFTHENVSWARQMTFTPDGRRLILAAEKYLFVWDLKKRELLQTWQGDDKSVESMALTSDGKRLATGGESGKVTFWDMETFQPQETIDAGVKNESESKKILAITFSSDDTLMATVSIDGPLRIWDVATGKPTITYNVNTSRIDDMLFLPDTKVVVIPSSDEQYSRSVWLVDAVTGKRVKPLKGHVDNVMSVRFLPKQNQVVTASMDGSIKFWDVDPAKLK